MNTAQHLSDDVLNAWLDDVLPDDERVTLEAHLAQCAECRRTADELATLKAALAALPQAEPPRSFRLTPEQASRPRPAVAAFPASPAVRLLPVMRTLSIAAVMALLIVSTALLLGQTSDNDASGGGETAQQSSSSLRQEAAAQANAPGEVVDQGEAASSDANAVPDLAAPQEQAVATGTEDDDGLSPLAITAIGLGGLSVVLLVSWLALARSGSASGIRFR